MDSDSFTASLIRAALATGMSLTAADIARIESARSAHGALPSHQQSSRPNHEDEDNNCEKENDDRRCNEQSGSGGGHNSDCSGVKQEQQRQQQLAFAAKFSNDDDDDSEKPPLCRDPSDVAASLCAKNDGDEVKNKKDETTTNVVAGRDGARELTTGDLTYSLIRAGVAEQLQLNAHSFAASRAVPYLWSWGAFCQLRKDINVVTMTTSSTSSSPPSLSSASSTSNNKKKPKSLAPPPKIPDQEIVDCLPLPQLNKRPDDVSVLRVVSCLPCASFTTHCVAVADTQVKYRISASIPTAAVMLDPSLNNKRKPKKAETGGDQQVRQQQQQQEQPAVALQQQYTVEATMVWRTMHFVRHDCKSIQDQGNFEIQSTSLRSFECRPVAGSSSSASSNGAVVGCSSNATNNDDNKDDDHDDDTFSAAKGVSSASASPSALTLRTKQRQRQFLPPLAWAGFVSTLLSEAPADPIFISPRAHPLSLRRSCLECYTRPTVHFIFAWMLWQNNRDLRLLIQRRIKSAMARKKANSAVAAAAATVTGAASASSNNNNKDAATTARTSAGSSSSTQAAGSAATRRGRAGEGGEQQQQHDADEEGEEDGDEVTIVDFLTDIKNKIWLTLFDHAPTFAVLGMGGNVIGNYLASLVPWCDVHIAELDGAVIASNIMNGDLPTKLQEEKRAHFLSEDNDVADDDNAAAAAAAEQEPVCCGRQFAYHRDVFDLLGVPLGPQKKTKEQQKNAKEKPAVIDVDASSISSTSSSSSSLSSSSSGKNNSSSKRAANEGDDDGQQERTEPLPKTVFGNDDFFSLIFLDCFDPVAVNMDHSRRVLAACHRRLRNNGILAVNTHLALTYSGAELRPFCEVFPGSESVQVVSIAGFQQALIVCQKRSPASIRRGPAPIFGGIREYRAVARIGSTCPVHINLGGGALRNIDTPQFFAPSVVAAEQLAAAEAENSIQRKRDRRQKLLMQQQQQQQKQENEDKKGSKKKEKNNKNKNKQSAGDDEDDEDCARCDEEKTKKKEEDEVFNWNFDVDDDVPFSVRLRQGGGGGGSVNDITFGGEIYDSQPCTSPTGFGPGGMGFSSNSSNNATIKGPRSVHYGRSCQCKARWRISDPCACLMCTTQFLDASIFESTVSTEVKLPAVTAAAAAPSQVKGDSDDEYDDGVVAAETKRSSAATGGASSSKKASEVEEEVISVRRWLTI